MSNFSSIAGKNDSYQKDQLREAVIDFEDSI